MQMQIMSVVGAVMILVAYALNLSGTWKELHAGYLLLNIVGSLLLGVVAIVDRRAGFILLEFSWAAIGALGVLRLIRVRRSQR